MKLQVIKSLIIMLVVLAVTIGAVTIGAIIIISLDCKEKPMVQTLPDRGLIEMQKDTVRVLSDNREDTVTIVMDNKGYNVYCTQGYTINK